MGIFAPKMINSRACLWVLSDLISHKTEFF